MFKFTIYTCHAPLPSLAPTRQTYPVAGPLTPLQTPNNAPSLIARLMLAILIITDETCGQPLFNFGILFKGCGVWWLILADGVGAVCVLPFQLSVVRGHLTVM